MGLLNIIHRMHKRQRLSIREIARLTGVSRNTVTKHLAANTIEPKFATPERASKLDPFAEKLAGWLKTEAGKSRKQRRTVKQPLVTLPLAMHCRPVVARRSRGAWLHRVLCPGGGFCAIVEGRSAA